MLTLSSNQELAAGVDSVVDEKLQGLLESLTAAEASLAAAKETATSTVAEVERLVKRNAANAEARESATAHSLAWLGALLDVASPSSLPSPPGRRRMLYLRDFGTLSYIFRPLLQALARATQDSQNTFIIVAGIWRYERLPENSASATSVAKQSARKQRYYLFAFEGNQSLKGWLDHKFPATWRRSRSSNSRFANLEDSFAACFSHCFGTAELYRRHYAQEMSVDENIKMTYAHSLAVGLLDTRCNDLGKRWGKEERERRLIAHNMRALSNALHGVGRKVELSWLYDVRPQDVTTRSQGELLPSLLPR
ncbi:hypothetical protein EXIGLDRAFT_781212 [Exidia glandulosa HHB12029]|uniref:Uncharacterized protein n=1 Tax=Exidia glandulosa HHB12029 TaxID=1314781 RepID=A0A165BB79_EXIGL|nr:hypothetical protein EXIGLDRAFT_781212 [Exidia glandulosa HHB12029]